MKKKIIKGLLVGLFVNTLFANENSDVLLVNEPTIIGNGTILKEIKYIDLCDNNYVWRLMNTNNKASYSQILIQKNIADNRTGFNTTAVPLSCNNYSDYIKGKL